MYVFNSSSRVTRTSDGILFDEQDILMCAYKFNKHLRIDMTVDYCTPGFGIAMILDDTENLAMTEEAYLFKIGSSDFSVYRNYQNTQTMLSTTASILSPTATNKNQHLIFELKDKTVTFYTYIKNTQGIEELYTLGTYTIPKAINDYFIGIYSNKGNVVRKISFEQLLPNLWSTSIDNTDGGRIDFIENGFIIENCLHDAELEQDGINLEPGKYYFTYDIAKINDEYDIDAFIFLQEMPDKDNEPELEDEQKNILAEDGSFILKYKSKVIAKFRGTNGQVSNISIHTNAYGGYVATDDAPIKQNGSCIDIKLKNISKVEWRAIVSRVPDYTDLTEEPPYGIIIAAKTKYLLEQLNIKLNIEYEYQYTKEADILIVKDLDGNIVSERKLGLNSSDTLCVMNNVNAAVYSIKLYYLDGNEADVIIQQDTVRYVPTTICSPIIVRDEKTKEVFDISASYREKINPRSKFILHTTKFSSGSITIPNDIPDNMTNIKVYGCSQSITINEDAESIDEYVDNYSLINSSEYILKKGILYFTESLLIKYPYLVIEYNDISDYSYVFTNYEREYFKATKNRTIELTKDVAISDSNVTIYAIKPDTFCNTDYLYRIMPKTADSIDCYTNNYDILSSEQYTLDISSSTIKLTQALNNTYDHFIIDYMKKNSYAINMNESVGQYEISISTDCDKIEVLYDMHDDGSSNEYMNLDISNSDNEFIVLRKSGEANED